MNQEQQENFAQKMMTEIVRLHDRLREGGYSNKSATAETTTEVINDKLVYTDTLKFDKTVLAQVTRIDPRPLAEIKTSFEAEKTRIQEQADEVIAKADEVIGLVEPEINKQSAK